jgi:hypothetical protein
MKAKKLREALQQMAEEGVVQLFSPQDGSGAIVGVVGALQLDVLKERLRSEYGLPIDFEPTRFTLARWVMADAKGELDRFAEAHGSSMARDLDGAPVFMAPTAFGLKYEQDRWPDVSFVDVKGYQAAGQGRVEAGEGPRSDRVRCDARCRGRKVCLAEAATRAHVGTIMFPSIISVALLVLAVIGTALVYVAVGIYNRLGLLIETIAELKTLAAGSQGELVQAKEGIGKVHSDLGRLVATTNMTSEFVRSASRLPTR